MDDAVERYIELMNRRKAGKTERYYLDLQPNELALLEAASRIYAAHVARGAVGDDDVDRMVRRAVHEAAKLAYLIESSVEDAAERRPEVD